MTFHAKHSRALRRRALSIALASCASFTATAAHAITFPSNAQWIPLTRVNTLTGVSEPIGDISGDAQNSRDIVGDAAHPLAYLSSDGAHIFFRLRINASSLQNATNFGPFGWGCLLDTDLDATDFEYSVLIDGVSNPDEVRFWKNTVQQTPNDPGDSPETLLKAYLDPLSASGGYAREMAAGQVFPLPPLTPDADFFVDWAVERSLFLAEGITDGTPLRIVCGSANNGTFLSADYSGAASLPLLLSDPLVCGASGCLAQTCAGFGHACTAGVGACKVTGAMVCNAQGAAVCNAIAGAPSAESCDGVDNDCNGSVDDGDPGGDQACQTGLPGACAGGKTLCAGGAITCLPAIIPGSLEETCDGIDQDCDGIVDDGFGLGEACTAGVGACEATGAMVCNALGAVVCSAVAGAPSLEICDGIDNDCNGAVDEGNPGGDVACQTGLPGACALGEALCASGSRGCVPDVWPGQLAEACDGQDNDCDGVVDDGFGVGAACSAGLGQCMMTGEIICDGKGGSLCTAMPGVPGVEICGDTLDTDCDGDPGNGCGDADADGLSDEYEAKLGTDPNDADSDDDGVPDGQEPKPGEDIDGDGLINALDPDSDGDWLLDGTEMGKGCSDPATDPAVGHCIPDADEGATTTSPLDPDTDAGGVTDGFEDADHNGRVDAGERDPNDRRDDVLYACQEDSDCGDRDSGTICSASGACRAGCRGARGNGCPEGQECSSTDARAGTCALITEEEGPLEPGVIPGGHGMLCSGSGAHRPGSPRAWMVMLAAVLFAWGIRRR